MENTQTRKRKQKMLYVPEDVEVMIKDWREKGHLPTDNQTIVNLIVAGYHALCNTK